MKRRALIVCSFALLLSAVSYAQESQISSTQLTKESTKSRGTVARQSQVPQKLSQNPLNTIESIDREIQVLENVLLINQDDQAFDRNAVINRIAELQERRKTLIH